MKTLTWKQLKNYLESMPADELAKPVVVANFSKSITLMKAASEISVLEMQQCIVIRD